MEILKNVVSTPEVIPLSLNTSLKGFDENARPLFSVSSEVERETVNLEVVGSIPTRRVVFLGFGWIMTNMLSWENGFRISVGGYHTCLSRREQGFESPIRKNNPPFAYFCFMLLNLVQGNLADYHSCQ